MLFIRFAEKNFEGRRAVLVFVNTFTNVDHTLLGLYTIYGIAETHVVFGGEQCRNVHKSGEAITFSLNVLCFKTVEQMFTSEIGHDFVIAGGNPDCELLSAMTNYSKNILFRSFELISRDTHLETVGISKFTNPNSYNSVAS